MSKAGKIAGAPHTILAQTAMGLPGDSDIQNDGGSIV
jgi:hypothetical protein